MAWKIILRKDGTYELYNRFTGQKIAEYTTPEEVFERISRRAVMSIDFVNERKIENACSNL